MLQIGPRERVVRKRRLLSVSGRRFAVEDACLAIARLPGLDRNSDEIGDWCVTALAQRHGVHLARLTRRCASPWQRKTLRASSGLRRGVRLMQLDRVMLSSEQAPIEWRSACCHLRDEYYLAEVS